MKRQSTVRLFVLLLLIVGVWGALRLWPGAFRVLALDVRRDLFLEPENVELVAGFEEFRRLDFRNDHVTANPDRDGLALPVFRSCQLRWTVDARPGVLRLGVVRQHPGPLADTTPCVIKVIASQNGQPLSGGYLEASVPPIGTDEDAPADRWREGPVLDLSLELPWGAQVLDIEVASGGEVPDGSYVALISPRIEQEPRTVMGGNITQHYDDELRIAPALDVETSAEPVPFGSRRTEEDTAIVPVQLPPVEVVGAFSGRVARPGVAFTGDAEVSGIVDIPQGSRLSAQVALDDRMPEGASGLLDVLVDDRLVATFGVEGVNWVPISVPLDDVAGPGRRLTLRARGESFEPRPVLRLDPDFVRGDQVLAEYVAERLRLGVADPRITWPAQVSARLATKTTPSVIVMHVETLRADLFLPFRDDLPSAVRDDTVEELRSELRERYGADLFVLAPHLTALAEQAVVYTRAFAPSPWTLPSTATLFTGLYPSAHGVVDHDRAVLPDDVPTLAERARDAGVVTGAVVTNKLLSEYAGYARGFQSFASVPFANAAQVNDLARAFLSNHDGQQAFLFLHYWDPHDKYNAPLPWRDRYVDPGLLGRDTEAVIRKIRDELLTGASRSPDDPDVRFLLQRYLGEVAFFDAQLGAFLAWLRASGLARTTALVLTADHGEEFFEHGLLGHGSQLFDETLRVPLLIVPPGGLLGGDGRDVTDVVSTGSLHAEVLDLLDVPYARANSLPPLSASRGFAFSETEKGLVLDGMGDVLRRPMRSVRCADRLLIVKEAVAEGEVPEVVLYDLPSDPNTIAPLAASGPEAEPLLQYLEQALDWSERHRAHRGTPGGDSELLETLQGLGYVGGDEDDSP